MKILMLIPFLPILHTSGGQTRWYNILKQMSKEHEITLFSLIKDDSEKRFISGIEKYCKKVRVFKRSTTPWTLRNILRTGFGKYPFLVIRNFSPEERRAISRELAKEKYDIIHAETFYVMPHIPETNIPSIMVEQTIEYQVYMHYVLHDAPVLLRPLLMIDVMKLKYWEKHFWKKTDMLVSVSKEDKKVMQRLIHNIDVDVIPNGVDSDYYSSKKANKLIPKRVLYGVTNFEWLQNVEAVEILIKKVWPEILKKNRKVKLWLVGRKIPKDILNLAKRRQDIEVTESIGDPREAYQGASVMAAPIKGSGGTRLKILEAMAAGLPVVSTPVGVAGLNLVHGKHVLISEDIDGLAKHTLQLLKNEKLAKKIGLGGKRFVREHFDWKAIIKLHEPIYRKAMINKLGKA